MLKCDACSIEVSCPQGAGRAWLVNEDVFFHHCSSIAVTLCPRCLGYMTNSVMDGVRSHLLKLLSAAKVLEPQRV